MGAVTCPTGSASDYDGVYVQQDLYFWNNHHVYQLSGGDSVNMRFNGEEWFISDTSGTFISAQNGDQGEDVPQSDTVWVKYDTANTPVAVYDSMRILGCTQG